MLTLSLSLALLAACNGDAEVLQDTGPGADDTAADDEPLLVYSEGTCPVLEDGKNNDFLSAGESRSFQLVLPDDPAGAPVLFAWHWLGGTANQTLASFDLEALSAEQGVIVIAPSSCCSEFEWDFVGGPAGNVDLALFDDALACLHQQFDVDLDRIWATGMSAGGLWTSYLTLHRAEALAATAPYSGGSDSWSYSTPAAQIPVMMTWGGPTDLYGTYSFDDASIYMSDALQADGHFVVECVHSSGHVLPPDDYLWPFLEAHPRGVEPEPWAGGLPAALPGYCAIP